MDRPSWACPQWGEWAHDMPDCDICSQAYTALQIANAGSDHFYELFIRRGGLASGYYTYYRSKEDLLWEDVPQAAMRDGELNGMEMYNAESVMEITAEEYFTHMWV